MAVRLSGLRKRRPDPCLDEEDLRQQDRAEFAEPVPDAGQAIRDRTVDGLHVNPVS